MEEKQLFEELISKFKKVLQEEGVESEAISIRAKSLSPLEAIGSTLRKDYPILAGREILLEAEYKGAKGQAFTDAPAQFEGKLEDILTLNVGEDPHARGLFIAAMNAVMRYLGLADKTIHCRDQEPEDCAKKAADFIGLHYGKPKIALVGYQPALLETLSGEFPLRVLDLNPENIGKKRYGVIVENGVDDFHEVVCEWAELVLCTGSTLCNGTILNFLDLDKEVLFFGTTLAGASIFLGCKRMCFCAR